MFGSAYVCENALAVQHLIEAYRTAGTLTSSIYNVYIVPRKFIGQTLGQNVEYEEFNNMLVPLTYSYQVSKPTTINSYTPRNKKLLTYPYCYLVLTNNNGISNILHYEKFTEHGTGSSGKCDFSISGMPVPRLLNKMYSIQLYCR